MSPSLLKWLDTVLSIIPEEKPSDSAITEPPLPVTENYPFQYEKEVEIRGHRYKFRPIRPDDDELMAELFGTFSEQTIYHRFFTHIRMTPERIKRFTKIDYRRQMAIVGVEKENGVRRLVGVARYAASRERENWAEMAVVVGDPWQRRGLGMALLNYLFEVARNEGYEGLFGLVHYDNRPIVRIFEQLEWPVTKRDDGTELVFEVLLRGAERKAG